MLITSFYFTEKITAQQASPKLLWKYSTQSAIIGSPIADDSCIYFGSTNGVVYSINKSTGDLKDVTVTVKKPMIEVRADKTILNVEGTVNSVGYDALELLRRSPGVMIDKDDNVSYNIK